MTDGPESTRAQRRAGLVAGAGHAVEGFGIVEIQNATFFRGRILADFFCVRPDDTARTDIGRCAFEFLVNARRKNDGMTTTTLENGEDHGSFGGIELLDQSVNKAFADERMIDQAEEHAVCAGREAAERGLKGAELTLLPLLIDHNLVGAQRNGFGDRFSVRAQDHTADANFRMLCHFEQVLEEGPSLIGEERFWGAHSS